MKTKPPFLKPLLPAALALLAILALTGCLEESTVVKINKDGSGVIHTRKYENTQVGKGFLGGLGGGEDQEEEEPLKRCNFPAPSHQSHPVECEFAIALLQIRA